MRKGAAALAVILIILSLASCAAAHAPQIPGANEGIQNAVHIDDPLKSRALYGTFPNAGSVAYYQFTLETGDRLWFSVFTPEIGAAYPKAVLIGPGIESSGEIPAGVASLDNEGYLFIPGEVPPLPEYEPFTPAANYQWLEYEYIAEAPGTYFIAMVNSGTGPGSYGLAVGYKEEFTLPEWVMIPISIADIRIWEGNSPAFVIGFPLLIVMFGLVYLFRVKKEPVTITLETVAGSAGGLLYIAGSVFMLIQALMALGKTGFEASFGVTAVFILIPLILGCLVLRYYVKPRKKPVGYLWLKLLILGLLGFVFWAGYVIGPVFVLCAGLAALFDAKNRERKASL
ncbi:MAG: hypothetical protein ALMCE001_01350 [Methanocorpusculum sp. MCE]|nr:MAG: hypothetical protein ALMCE001_01350 [Methanocorpusculum sp. MCE]